jgi:quercetin dioxygenase-like cupin family protein
MSTQLATKSNGQPNHNKLRRNPDGTLVEFLASPDETGEDLSLIRGTLPPGTAVPLHSHQDVELFYILEGSVEVFQPVNGAYRWIIAGAGDAVSIPGNAKHAWRNRSSLPATMVIVTTAKMYEFFYEVSKPFDPHRPAAPPTPEELNDLLQAAARHGYWMASQEENSAIGLTVSLPAPLMSS